MSPSANIHKPLKINNLIKKSAGCAQLAHKTYQQATPINAIGDERLALVMKAWVDLPEAMRIGILAMVKAAMEEGSS
jgi:hypothetical protein